MKFALGSRLKDVVSGFSGVATARIEYLNGCKQYCVVPPVDKDGKKVDGIYFDEGQLEVCGEPLVMPKEPASLKASRPGGPSSSAPQRSNDPPH